MQRTSKIAKNMAFIPAETCGLHDDVMTLFGVIDDTTATKFTGRACAVHSNSLPVVVVVLKFPINEPSR